ncbi:MAG: hypothetical protein FWD29_06255 [Micrococcales bacterium]|nr:hypothetical protein [Micrococcales bacterium]
MSGGRGGSCLGRLLFGFLVLCFVVFPVAALLGNEELMVAIRQVMPLGEYVTGVVELVASTIANVDVGEFASGVLEPIVSEPNDAVLAGIMANMSKFLMAFAIIGVLKMARETALNESAVGKWLGDVGIEGILVPLGVSMFFTLFIDRGVDLIAGSDPTWLTAVQSVLSFVLLGLVVWLVVWLLGAITAPVKKAIALCYLAIMILLKLLILVWGCGVIVLLGQFRQSDNTDFLIMAVGLLTAIGLLVLVKIAIKTTVSGVDVPKPLYYFFA